MIAHMDSGLVDIGCPGEGRRFFLKNEYLHPMTCTEVCGVKTVKACTDYDFVVLFHRERYLVFIFDLRQNITLNFIIFKALLSTNIKPSDNKKD